MTPADWDALDTYLQRLADTLALKDWQIKTERDKWAGDDCEAKVWPTTGRKHARVRISDEFRGYDADRQRAALVHELLHCHLAQAAHLVEYDLRESLGAAAHAPFFNAFRRAIEYGVDGIADGVAPLLPGIEWPQEQDSPTTHEGVPVA